jgi:molecular chaperone GrpE
MTMPADDVAGDAGEPIDEFVDAPDDIGAVIEQDLGTLLAERDQFKDIALRLQADFDNYRKREAKDRADAIDRATGKVAESLLGVLDACEAAFAHGVEGVEPIWSKLIGELQRQGLEAMDCAGKPFDPHEHDAVAHEADEESDGDPPVVSEVLRTGYRWKGKVLRPAMVKVRG